MERPSVIIVSLYWPLGSDCRWKRPSAAVVVSAVWPFPLSVILAPDTGAPAVLWRVPCQADIFSGSCATAPTNNQKHATATTSHKVFARMLSAKAQEARQKACLDLIKHNPLETFPRIKISGKKEWDSFTDIISRSPFVKGFAGGGYEGF